MDTIDAAAAAGDAINGLGSHFMLDMATYAYGAEIGFDGVDFYVAGRGGALGDVPGGVVAAAFVFYEPAYVAASWDRSADVMARSRAAEEFIGVGHRWADAKVPDDAPAARLAELAGRIADAASPAAAPLFAGWRTVAEPERDRPKALALHRVNVLRELRGALHGAAVLAAGVTPFRAVARRTPYMLPIFGWGERSSDETKAIAEEVRDDWDRAQAGTERAMAPAYGSLTPAERQEFVELVNATQAAVTPG